MDYKDINIGEDVLQHHGVKGMKWGIRRNRTQSSGTSRRKSKQSDDHVRAKELKKKKLSQLSNAELKELNNRMNLESQYRNLKRQNVSAGQRFVRDVAYETAKNTASEYARKYAKEGIKFVSSKAVSGAYIKRNGHV